MGGVILRKISLRTYEVYGSGNSNREEKIPCPLSSSVLFLFSYINTKIILIRQTNKKEAEQ